MNSQMKRREQTVQKKTKYRILVYDNSKVSMLWGLKLKPYLQYIPRWIIDLKTKKKIETIKVPEDNVRENFFTISQWHY